MKKIIFSVFVTVLVFGVSGAVNAEVNAVTPSTNDINRTNGWAHVDQIDVDTESVTLEFINTRSLWSCFEYRTDGDTSQSTGDNYNSDITDGLYPFFCQNNSSRVETINANEYVEVRMVFGGETDERFDWTRFDVLFERIAEITSPTDGEIVNGLVSFDAVLNDKDGDDAVQWAVRKGTCAPGPVNNVLGNVGGYNTPYDWDYSNFHTEADVSSWEDGEYCFVFNPKESVGDAPIRLTRDFYVSNPPTEVSQCKKGGWESFSNPAFKNQGDCVSWLNSNENANGNRKNN